MKARVQKWGNSMALRLPKPITEEVHVRPGSAVELSVSRGKLIVLPLKSRPVSSLSSLLRRISRQNLHDEIDTGMPVGNEIW